MDVRANYKDHIRSVKLHRLSDTISLQLLLGMRSSTSNAVTRSLLYRGLIVFNNNQVIVPLNVGL